MCLLNSCKMSLFLPHVLTSGAAPSQLLRSTQPTYHLASSHPRYGSPPGYPPDMPPPTHPQAQGEGIGERGAGFNRFSSPSPSPSLQVIEERQIIILKDKCLCIQAYGLCGIYVFLFFSFIVYCVTFSLHGKVTPALIFVLDFCHISVTFLSSYS